MKKLFIFCCIACAGCAGIPEQASTHVSKSVIAYDVEEMVSRRISVYEKYDEMMPSIIHDLKQCRAADAKNAHEYRHYTKCVVDYGVDLEIRGCVDAEMMTVKNERYWKSVFSLPAMDITALLSRLLLMMREGELARAKVLLLFCLYDRNTAWERDSTLINTIWQDITSIRDKSDHLISIGIEEWDKGNRKAAIDMYRRAMEVYPKNPWALWELALDHFTYNLDPDEISDGRFEDRYELIRRIDPHYEMAHFQGKVTDAKKVSIKALQNQVIPSYEKLWNGEHIAESMRDLADGYLAMKEYEFAIYAYKYLLFRPEYQRFDPDIVEKICLCLDELGMSDSRDFLEEMLLVLSARLFTVAPTGDDMKC